MSQLKKGAILSYINIFLNVAIGLVLTPFIIRSLGDSEYGLYTLIGSFVAYLSLMDLGLNNTIIRFVSKYRAEKDKRGEEVFLGTTMKIYGIISIILVVIGLILYFNLENIFSQSLNPEQMMSAKIMFLILVFNLAITLPGGAFTAICNAYEQFVFPRLLGIVRYILRALTVVAVLTMSGKAISLVVIDTVFNISVIAVTFLYVILKQKVVFDFSKWDKVMVKQIFSYSIWIFIFAIIQTFQWNTGQMILGITTDTIQVAIYAVGIMLGTYYGSFASAINNLLLPRANRFVANTNDSVLLTNEMIKIGRLISIILFWILGGFLLTGKDFINIWVGENYAKSYWVALFIMIVMTIPLSQSFGNSIIEAKNKVSFRAKATAVSMSLGLIVGYFLSINFGIIGLISAISGAFIINTFINNWYYNKIFGFEVFRFFKNVFAIPLLLLIIVSILIYLLQSTLHSFSIVIQFTIKVIAYSIIYLPLVIFIFLDKGERTSLLKLKTRTNAN